MALPTSVSDLMATGQRICRCQGDMDDVIDGSTGRVIVIDDDPTGTQPVRSVPVVTRWSVDDLTWALEQDSRVVFVSTNSRSMPVQQAIDVIGEVVESSLQ